MTIAEMKQRKKELGYTNEKVSELSGVPLGTVQKIFAGVTDSPRYETLMSLEKLFKEKHDRVEEAVMTYQVKRQGGFTLEDYYALPDEQRVELIDGVFYDMASPTSIHQMISAEICRLLKEYIDKKGRSCIPLAAAIDVQLDRDDKTMVQPDVLVVCDRNKIIRRCVYGAPDFIAEILSLSTRRKDMTVKLKKYSESGVKEYWLVDPDRKKVVVYDLENEELPVVYGFDAKIPVRIFDGGCEIDFAAIYDYISFLYDEPEVYASGI